MDKRMTRALSIGLFLSAILLFGFQLSSNDQPLQVKDLKKEGYVVLTEAEYKELTDKVQSIEKELKGQTVVAQGEQPKQEEPKTEEPKQEEPKPEEPKQEEPKPEEPKQEEPKPEAPKPAPITYKLKIETGMTSFEIAEKLVEQKIIKEADETNFRVYMNDNKFAEKIQLGEFTVNSEMSFNEIAKIITKNR
ncbi:hypothetical protein WAK64_02015 [Bacillus spongiae]|uniref:Endolytic transglycosylase MltG n=1 Tax=Bacillus spongiae TaxID=2683610 RepID=A0ABU8H9B5_9BACI